MSPERLNDEDYSLTSDIWSLGIIMFEYAFLRHNYAPNKIYSFIFEIAKGKLLQDYFQLISN